MTVSDDVLVNPFGVEPHAWIQWKGTHVCMDVHCACGELFHVDGEFAYYVKCRKCGATYAVNGHVKLHVVPINFVLEIEPRTSDE